MAADERDAMFGPIADVMEALAAERDAMADLASERRSEIVRLAQCVSEWEGNAEDALNVLQRVREMAEDDWLYDPCEDPRTEGSGVPIGRVLRASDVLRALDGAE